MKNIKRTKNMKGMKSINRMEGWKRITMKNTLVE